MIGPVRIGPMRHARTHAFFKCCFTSTETVLTIRDIYLLQVYDQRTPPATTIRDIDLLHVIYRCMIRDASSKDCWGHRPATYTGV